MGIRWKQIDAMRIFPHAFLAVLLVASSFSFLGFGIRKHFPAGTSKKDRDAAVDYLDSLYYRYLREDTRGARSAMIEAAVYIKKSPIPELKSALFLCYFRLSVLEQRAGNPKEAKKYYERGLHGRNPAEFTREECERIVTHWDNTYSKGAGPKYMNELKEKAQQ